MGKLTPGNAGCCLGVFAVLNLFMQNLWSGKMGQCIDEGLNNLPMRKFWNLICFSQLRVKYNVALSFKSGKMLLRCVSINAIRRLQGNLDTWVPWFGYQCWTHFSFKTNKLMPFLLAKFIYQRWSEAQTDISLLQDPPTNK